MEKEKQQKKILIALVVFMVLVALIVITVNLKNKLSKPEIMQNQPETQKSTEEVLKSLTAPDENNDASVSKEATDSLTAPVLASEAEDKKKEETKTEVINSLTAPQ